MVAGTVYAAQVSFHHDSGLPEDRVSNVFHFATTQVSGIDFPNLVDMLSDFYNVHEAGGAQVCDFMSSNLAGTFDVSVYHLTDPSPRVPVYEETGLPIALPVANSLPSEVACCVSWTCPPVSGIPPARLRGRTYVGPLNVTAADANGRPTAAFLATLVAAGDGLVTAADASVTWDLVVYSTAIAGGSGDGARANKITGGWVDNAFDTQRRRGEAALSRTLFSL